MAVSSIFVHEGFHGAQPGIDAIGIQIVDDDTLVHTGSGCQEGCSHDGTGVLYEEGASAWLQGWFQRTWENKFALPVAVTAP